MSGAVSPRRRAEIPVIRHEQLPPAAGRDVSLAVVIPTRNRSTLAIEAVGSLLDQPDCRYHIFVSDNSTDPEESRRLADFCTAAASERLTYLRPDPLPMAAHWDWALRTAMERSTATHFTIHYDRRITKPRHLAPICEAMAAFPDDVITFAYDLVIGDGRRSVVWQPAWDGCAYIVPTARVVQMTVKGRISEMVQSFPVLSNCAVPREVLLAIARRFGTICDSTAPDSTFTYRFCAIADRYVHYDRCVGVAYAYDRSTGFGFINNDGRDFTDFMQWWGDKPWLDAAPIPGLNIGQNVLFHEYELVRRAVHDQVFQPVDFQGYLHELGSSLLWVSDRRHVLAMTAILKQHGWDSSRWLDDLPRPHRATRVRDGLPWLRTLLRDLWEMTALGHQPEPDAEMSTVGARVRVLVWKVWKRSKRLWMATRLAIADHLHVPIDDLTGYEFESDRQAIDRVLSTPRPRAAANPRLVWLSVLPPR